MSLVAGIDKFKEAMRGHEGKYVLIGGGACSILFDQIGADFRLTKDLDVVVLVDDADPSFGRAIWDFVSQGGYEAGRRSEGGCTYYRFVLPKGSPKAGVYPGEIELFALHPDFVLEDEDSHIVPLPFNGVVSSLSAIILDSGYYEFIRENVEQVEGVPVLSALHIIPLKMRAHIDNMRLSNKGVMISEKTLRKHRSDVVYLSGLLTESSRLSLSDQMLADAVVFFEDFELYVLRETKAKRRAVLEEKLRFLRGVYLREDSK